MVHMRVPLVCWTWSLSHLCEGGLESPEEGKRYLSAISSTGSEITNSNQSVLTSYEFFLHELTTFTAQFDLVPTVEKANGLVQWERVIDQVLN